MASTTSRKESISVLVKSLIGVIPIDEHCSSVYGRGLKMFQGTPAAVSRSHVRWLQLVAGIICMVMIANLQYAWTLFVGPIDATGSSGHDAVAGSNLPLGINSVSALGGAGPDD
jgi:hypothetical protein